MSEESLSNLGIRLLGQFRVLQNGVEVAGFGSRNARGLIALLVIANGSAMPYEQLAMDYGHRTLL